MAKPHKTTAEAGAQITRGDFSWMSERGVPVSLTWAFRASVPATYENSDSNEGKTFARMNAAEMAAVRDALQRFADVADITFRQVSETGASSGFSDRATLLFGTYANPDDAAEAFAYLPGETVGAFSGDRSFAAMDGDLWYNRALSGQSPRPGDYDFLTFLHEIGHTLGLDHPGDYDAAPGLDITYERDAVYFEDTIQYTVMSYFDASDSHNGANHSYTDAAGRRIDVYATTLLKDDIAAIQRLYGANTTTRHDATTYGFHANADGYDIDGATPNQVVFCIYDTGGNDTLDLSGYATNQRIDLRPGALSDAGLLRKNISIAEGTIVENAIGGSGGDTIIGNDAGNRLDGRGGHDAVRGGAGDDTVIVDDAGDTVFEKAGEGTDTVVAKVSYALQAGQAIECLYADARNGAAAIDLTGNAFAQTLRGNAGDNILDGKGGADALYGFAGDDSYVVDDAADSVFEAAGQGHDTVVALVSYALAAGQEVETLQLARSTGRTNLSLEGNAFAQTLLGNAGANKLNGGLGADVLTGRGGADSFVFATAPGSGNVDHITDFAPEDTIRLAKAVFSALAPGHLGASAFKNIGTGAVDGDDRILYKQATGELFYDADGSGTGVAVTFAVLDNHAALTSADFLIV